MTSRTHLVVLFLENVLVVDAGETRAQHLNQDQEQIEIEISAQMESRVGVGVGFRVAHLFDDAADSQQDERRPLVPREAFVEKRLENEPGDDDPELEQEKVGSWVV